MDHIVSPPAQLRAKRGWRLNKQKPVYLKREIGLPSFRRLTVRRLPYQTSSFVHVRDARVLTPGWHVLTTDGLLVNDHAKHHKWLVPEMCADEAVLYYPREVVSVREPCVLLGGFDNYYHHLVDYVCALFSIEKNEEARRLPLLTLHPYAEFQNEMFAHLGIRDLITVPKFAAAKCASLLIPPRPIHGLGEVSDPDVIRWLRERFGAPANRGRRIYISRRMASTRRLQNEAELLDMLLPLGFEVVSLENMRFSEQIELFGQASAIVGPHGAGFTNMLFAAAGCLVVDIMPMHAQRPNAPGFRPYLHNLAGRIGHNYHCVLAATHGKQEISIDASHVRMLVEKALSGDK